MKCSSCNKSIPEAKGTCPHCGASTVQKCLSCDVVYPENARFCMLCGSTLEPVVPPVDTAAENTDAISVSDSADDDVAADTDESIEIDIDNDQKQRSSSYIRAMSGEAPDMEETPGMPAAESRDDVDESSLRIEEIVDEDTDEQEDIEPDGAASVALEIETENPDAATTADTADPEDESDDDIPEAEILEAETVGDDIAEAEKIPEADVVEPVVDETINDKSFAEPDVSEEQTTEESDIEKSDDISVPGGQTDSIEKSNNTVSSYNPDDTTEELSHPDVSSESPPEVGIIPETTEQTAEKINLNVVRGAISDTGYAKKIVPVFDAVENKINSRTGGMWFIREQNGMGSQFLVERIRAARKNQSGTRVVISEANLHEFDYILFINLIKELLNIRTDGENTIRAKVRSFFGDAVAAKADIITAILALNFQPLKHRLPKNEIQYLISYMLYIIAEKKPVIWMIHNAGHINTRASRLFANLRHSLAHIPLEIVFITEPEAPVLAVAKETETHNFPGLDRNEIMTVLSEHLGTKRIPADVEKELNKAGNNVLFAVHFIEFLKDRGLIFKMRDSWRFSKLPDSLEYPDNIDNLIMLRLELLEKNVRDVLKRLVLLNLNPIALPLIRLSNIDEAVLNVLEKKHFIKKDGDFYTFTSNTILNIFKKNVTLEGDNTDFFRDVVANLSKVQSPVFNVNKHWLLLKFIILGSIRDQKLNPFLFTAAIYMEKIGFLEMAQRIYQAILSNLEKNETYEDLKLLIDFKNAKLMKQIEPDWAKIFWDKLGDIAHKKRFRQLDFYAKTQRILIEDRDLDISGLSDLVKKLHQFGCYEDELTAIDQAVEVLLEKGDLSTAEKFAKRACYLLEKETADTKLLSVLKMRFSCSLSEIKIMLGAYNEAQSILEKLNTAETGSDNSFLSARRKYLMGQLNFLTEKPWEDTIREGFFNAVSGMNFRMIKKYFKFFIKHDLLNQDWVTPYSDYRFILDFDPD